MDIAPVDTALAEVACRRSFKLVIALAAIGLALALASCGGDQGGDDAADTSADDVSRAAQTLPDADLRVVVTSLADGFGDLDAAQRRAVQGAANGDAVCTGLPGPRARPAVSQVEVEIVQAIDGCLRFSYDVANFRTLVADIQRLRQQPNVVAASPQLLDYRLSQIESPWPITAISGSDLVASSAGPQGDGVVIAVIDSGIDTSMMGLENAQVIRAPNTGEGDYAATGHGTIAASIIVSPIGGSARGIAPAATLLDVPADLCDETTCGCDPCADLTAAAAIQWATDNGANVISMSFGYVPAEKPSWWQRLIDAKEIDSATESMAVALAYAESRGVAMVAAAGNCAGEPTPRCESVDQFEIPAGHDAVIAVGALEQDADGASVQAWYSTSQDYVELAAPGSLVITGPDGETYEKMGTSYATPFVAAAFAVLIGSDGPLADRPNSHLLAHEVLVDTAADLGPTGRDPASGHGLLQIDASIERATQRAEELRAAATAEGDVAGGPTLDRVDELPHGFSRPGASQLDHFGGSSSAQRRSRPR